MRAKAQLVIGWNKNSIAACLKRVCGIEANISLVVFLLEEWIFNETTCAECAVPNGVLCQCNGVWGVRFRWKKPNILVAFHLYSCLSLRTRATVLKYIEYFQGITSWKNSTVVENLCQKWIHNWSTIFPFRFPFLLAYFVVAVVCSRLQFIVIFLFEIMILNALPEFLSFCSFQLRPKATIHLYVCVFVKFIATQAFGRAHSVDFNAFYFRSVHKRTVHRKL